MKVLGERSAGNPHATFDVAGAGNGRGFYQLDRASSRPYLCRGRQVTDVPTATVSIYSISYIKIVQGDP